MNDVLKRVSPAILVVVILMGAGIIVGALIFGDDGPDLADRLADKRQVLQPMELRGDWLGMSLVDLNAASARRANIPPSVKGVMVVEISETVGWRARQAGIMPRDVITGIGKSKIADINDFYDVTRKVDVAEAVFIDVSRWGQPMTLVIPAAYRPMPQAGQPQVMMNGMGQQQLAMPQVAQQQMLPQGQAQAWPQQQMPQQQAQVVAQQQGWPQQAMMPAAMNGQQQAAAQPQGPLWVCPRHGLGWHQNVVQPGFRCPLCNGALRIAQ
jgi:hypothetical protein